MGHTVVIVHRAGVLYLLIIVTRVRIHIYVGQGVVLEVFDFTDEFVVLAHLLVDSIKRIDPLPVECQWAQKKGQNRSESHAISE